MYKFFTILLFVFIIFTILIFKQKLDLANYKIEKINQSIQNTIDSIQVANDAAKTDSSSKIPTK